MFFDAMKGKTSLERTPTSESLPSLGVDNALKMGLQVL